MFILIGNIQVLSYISYTKYNNTHLAETIEDTFCKFCMLEWIVIMYEKLYT